jgi:hypothetical protein
MNIGDTVKVISKASYKHYKRTGKIIKECNSKWKRMLLVEFGENDKARFYIDSLELQDNI